MIVYPPEIALVRHPGRAIQSKRDSLRAFDLKLANATRLARRTRRQSIRHPDTRFGLRTKKTLGTGQRPHRGYDIRVPRDGGVGNMRPFAAPSYSMNSERC